MAAAAVCSVSAPVVACCVVGSHFGRVAPAGQLCRSYVVVEGAAFGWLSSAAVRIVRNWFVS